MKILLIDPINYTPYYNYNFLNSLLKKDLNVYLVTSIFTYDNHKIPPQINNNIIYLYNKVKYKNLFIKVLVYIYLQRDLLRFIKKNKIDIVHYIWFPVKIVDFIILLYLKKRLKIPIVYTCHNPVHHEAKFYNLFIDKILYKNVDRIISLTNFVKSEIIKLDHTSKNKIKVIAHGDFNCLLSLYKPNEELKEAIQGWKKDSPLLMYHGAIRPYKGINDLLWLFKQLRDREKKLKLILAGRPFKIHKHEIDRMIEQYNLRDSIYTDLRYVPLNFLLTYVSVSDVGLLTYKSASQSGVVPIYYYFGVPMMVTNVGGLPEIVESGKTGYLISNINDVDTIHKNLSDIINRRDYFKKNIKYVLRNYLDWESLGNLFVELYSKIIIKDEIRD